MPTEWKERMRRKKIIINAALKRIFLCQSFATRGQMKYKQIKLGTQLRRIVLWLSGSKGFFYKFEQA